ncbi:hypothetical protein MPSEU_000970400 [Mayamaea pseudoterrestris]|nr:hypothetical protein MPSEU_000970400 [Mayamaea pseudoterrestris]
MKFRMALMRFSSSNQRRQWKRCRLFQWSIFAFLVIVLYWDSQLLNRQTRITLEDNDNHIQHATVILRETKSSADELPLSNVIASNMHLDGNNSAARNVTPATNERDHFFGAYFANGSYGYVADPKALARAREEFLLRRIRSSNTAEDAYSPYQSLLLHYHVPPQENITALRNVCSKPAGTMDEAFEGVELLTRQIQVASNASYSPPIRLLCANYTHFPMRSLARVAALSYGYKCDGFVAFSTETVAALGLVRLRHDGDETYDNMWQKVKSIWSYIRRYYADDYDFFHLGGDDMYVLVENMRAFLGNLPEHDRQTPLHLGQWVRQREHPYVAGGPGYTLNRAALLALVDDSLPTCQVDTVAPFEDKLVSQCLRQVGIYPYDTRHLETGQQRYHGAQPSTIYKSRPRSGRGASLQARQQAYFEALPHPSRNNETVGPQYGLDAAAPDSVSFHNIHNPVYMGRVHAILYPESCPAGSEMRASIELHRLHGAISG